MYYRLVGRVVGTLNNSRRSIMTGCTVFPSTLRFSGLTPSGPLTFLHFSLAVFARPLLRTTEPRLTHPHRPLRTAHTLSHIFLRICENKTPDVIVFIGRPFSPGLPSPIDLSTYTLTHTHNRTHSRRHSNIYTYTFYVQIYTPHLYAQTSTYTLTHTHTHTQTYTHS